MYGSVIKPVLELDSDTSRKQPKGILKNSKQGVDGGGGGISTTAVVGGNMSPMSDIGKFI